MMGILFQRQIVIFYLIVAAGLLNISTHAGIDAKGRFWCPRKTNRYHPQIH